MCVWVIVLLEHPVMFLFQPSSGWCEVTAGRPGAHRNVEQHLCSLVCWTSLHIPGWAAFMWTVGPFLLWTLNVEDFVFVSETFIPLGFCTGSLPLLWGPVLLGTAQDGSESQPAGPDALQGRPRGGGRQRAGSTAVQIHTVTVGTSRAASRIRVRWRWSLLFSGWCETIIGCSLIFYGFLSKLKLFVLWFQLDR